jgi:hypothetical protein
MWPNKALEPMLKVKYADPCNGKSVISLGVTESVS